VACDSHSEVPKNGGNKGCDTAHRHRD